MSPILLSQRDPKWSGLTLGESSKTIGRAGCTITCLGMKYGITPDVINELLKQNDAFYPENPNDPFSPEKDLVWWTKLPTALPGVTFITRYTNYDRSIVMQNLPCIVEVNGAPIGGVRHWVLYVSENTLYDPWDGQEKPIGTYQPISFVVLGGTYLKATQPEPSILPQDDQEKYFLGLDLTNKESMRAAVKVWHDVMIVKKYREIAGGEDEELRHYRDIRAVGYTTIDDINKIITDKDNSILALQDEIAKVRHSNGQLAETIQGIEKQDSESVRLAQQALEQNKVLTETLHQLARITETPDAKPESIVKKVFSLKSVADRVVRQKQGELMEKAKVKADNLKPAESSSGVTLLLRIFNLVPSKGGVQNG